MGEFCLGLYPIHSKPSFLAMPGKGRWDMNNPTLESTLVLLYSVAGSASRSGGANAIKTVAYLQCHINMIEGLKALDLVFTQEVESEIVQAAITACTTAVIELA